MELKIKALTVVIYFNCDEQPENLMLGSRMNGGTITAIAAYDLFDGLLQAENALSDNGDDDASS